MSYENRNLHKAVGLSRRVTPQTGWVTSEVTKMFNYFNFLKKSPPSLLRSQVCLVQNVIFHKYPS